MSDVIFVGGDVAAKDFFGDGMVLMGVEWKEDPAWDSGQYCGMQMEIGMACKGYGIAGGNNCHGGDFEWL